MLARINKDQLGDSSEESSSIVYDHIPLWNELMLAGKTGAGMFVESYFIFAIGNISAIYKSLYPTCYSPTGGVKGIPPVPGSTCNTEVTLAIPYVQISAIIAGMIGFGYMADHLGRLWGSRSTAVTMLIGSVLLTISFGSPPLAEAGFNGQFIMFNICMFVFALGVGGEYPMASSNASERSEAENLKRGRTVALTFALQGWGAVVNTMVIAIMLAATGTAGCTPALSIQNMGSSTSEVKISNPSYWTKYGAFNANGTGSVCNAAGLEAVWRVQYAVGIPVIAVLVYYRFIHVKESQVWKNRQDKFDQMTDLELRAKRIKDAKMLFSRKYFPRLIGAAGTWLVWDIAFYGNKLFQGKIIAAVIGGGNGDNVDLGSVMNYTLLNATIGLVGYYVAAATIDYKWMGRVRMQNMGFTISAALFLACGYSYDYLLTNVPLFEFIYFMSTFFGQFGPNVTTWLLPVELFPTDIRSQAHGISAATGKVGALIAALIFTYGNNGKQLSPQDSFLVFGYSCVVGLIMTILFVPDITGERLETIDRRWSLDLKTNASAKVPPDSANLNDPSDMKKAVETASTSSNNTHTTTSDKNEINSMQIV